MLKAIALTIALTAAIIVIAYIAAPRGFVSAVLERLDTEKQARAEVKAKAQAKINQLINDHQIDVGMTSDQVILSWGTPERVNRADGSWGVREQWIYQNTKGEVTYLYFDNGMLASWQDFGVSP